ncbi:dephospho-CoA kinase [Moraxella sp. ZY200743]|uniref:dephospho-CoA kinase n=1 Tax=Moraxella sp. ZY200743 TaxID=2911970 RepID=UPI003D7D8BB4
MTLTIGLTGGIGSGKSAVSDWFAQQHIDVIDADVIAHTISTKGSPVLDELVAVFGEWVIDADGNYHRPAMREHLLAHPDDINKLNTITHPHIQHAIRTALANSNSAYRILSVPLLVEGMGRTPNLAQLCQRILVVDVPLDIQRQRAIKRDIHKLSHTDQLAYVNAIIAKQATRAQRLAVADDIVDNSQSLAELYSQLQRLHQLYLQHASQISHTPCP